MLVVVKIMVDLGSGILDRIHAKYQANDPTPDKIGLQRCFEGFGSNQNLH
jgi:hypothetical protein